MSWDVLDLGDGMLRGTVCSRLLEGASGNGKKAGGRGRLRLHRPDGPGLARQGLLGHCQDFGLYP